MAVSLPANFGKRASITHLRIDETHGNAYAAWLAQGSPSSPSNQQLANLRQAMEPALLEPIRTVDTLDGPVNLDFSLPRFGLSLITISPATNNVDAGPPLEMQSPALFASGGGCACSGARTKPTHVPSTLVLLALGVASMRRCREKAQAPVKFAQLRRPAI